MLPEHTLGRWWSAEWWAAAILQPRLPFRVCVEDRLPRRDVGKSGCRVGGVLPVKTKAKPIPEMNCQKFLYLLDIT